MDRYTLQEQFFDTARHDLTTPVSFDKPPPDMRLRSVKEESDASRLLSLKSFFLVKFLSFLVIMMFVLRKQGGNLLGRKGPCVERRVCIEEFSSVS